MNNAYEYIINKAGQTNCTRREGEGREGRGGAGNTEMIYRRKACIKYLSEEKMKIINKSNVL